ncbi:hypothetical protein H6F61_24105 [Cyanobacteria bacterium FACHB-472]|nr:hypothetical protein [Cyanobacteria bacterium FACHB-472]
MTDAVEIVLLINKKEDVILKIPFEKEQKPLVDVFLQVLNLLILPGNPTLADIALSAEIQCIWTYGLLWLAQDYFELWKITDFPFSDPQVRACEAFGDVLIATRRLCKEVIKITPNLHYKNPLDFTKEVVI